MAWFSVDIFRKALRPDGYSCRIAFLAAREKIKEAYEHGFRYVRHKEDGSSIKFALRDMLRSGELAG